MTNYAEMKEHFAHLSDDFGLDLAKRWSGMTEEELAEALGRNTRGKRIGKIRGKLVWHKAVKGGWVKTDAYDHERGQASGFVAKRNACFNKKVVDFHGETILSFADDLKAEAAQREKYIASRAAFYAEELAPVVDELEKYYSNKEIRECLQALRDERTEGNKILMTGILKKRRALRKKVASIKAEIAGIY